MQVVVQPVPQHAAIGAATVAVVIDVLRATTTLTVALRNGAAAVEPATSPEEAFAMRERLGNALLCGERDGLMIPGFDVGNSPAEYDAGRVRDQTLIFASTNGSMAMHGVRHAKRRVLAAFINASAVVNALAHERHVTVVCAGKGGRFAMEDVACAGWLLRHWCDLGATPSGAGARLALALAPRDPHEVAALVAGCSHGRELRRLGPAYAADVAFASRLDMIDQAYEL